VLLPQKVRNERVHAGRDEEHCRVVVGYKGLALYLRMAVYPEKLYVFSAKFIGCHVDTISYKRGLGNRQ